MRARFAARRITAPIIKTRTHAALHRFDDFLVFHFHTVKIGADAA